MQAALFFRHSAPGGSPAAAQSGKLAFRFAQRDDRPLQRKEIHFRTLRTGRRRAPAEEANAVCTQRRALFF